jgi:hypothetical protein
MRKMNISIIAEESQSGERANQRCRGYTCNEDCTCQMPLFSQPAGIGAGAAFDGEP